MATPSNPIAASRLGLELDGPFGELHWCLIAASGDSEAEASLRDALESVEVRHRVVRPKNPQALLASPASTDASIVVGTSGWTDADYSALDRLRTRLRDARPVLVWLTTPDAASRLLHRAPNFAAFFGPNVGVWADDAMSAEEVEAHLVALRDRYGEADAEVVAMAERGELPQTVDHHAWLVLLGRGDLIVGSAQE